MNALLRTQGFPSARLEASGGGLPVEVSLITQLGHGAGDKMFTDATARQRMHAGFIDEMDEPSARLGGMDLGRGDATSLYSFAVGPKGHPFHRHAGHRVFTAISGSGGTQLRFSTATPSQVDEDPESFLQALRYINIPADCLFTVRFGGNTWHQFAPLSARGNHPAFFALSCHTNELGGDLEPAARRCVATNQASIPALTVLLPAGVAQRLASLPAERLHVPTIQLSLDAVPGSLHAVFCKSVRCAAGIIRGVAARWRRASGFLRESGGRLAVTELDGLQANSLIEAHLPASSSHHQDTFRISLPTHQLDSRDVATLMSRILQGFIDHPPAGVSRMMALRNVLVRPLGLRTSPLGCPVSSLLSARSERLFAERFPVLDQHLDADGRLAQVILGANDKHLMFRSCVSIERVTAQRIDVTLATRVHCKNLFGRCYMEAIQRVHRSYIAPTLLRTAVEHALPLIQVEPSLVADAWMGIAQPT